MRPSVVTLTIILKLRTQRGTEHLLHTTQTHVTNMLHDVTARFFNDLEKIDTDATDHPLSDAILDLVRAHAGHHPDLTPTLAQLRCDLEALHQRAAGIGFVRELITAAASADRTTAHSDGWLLLRNTVAQWYTDHADQQMHATIKNVQAATRHEPVTDKDGPPLEDDQGKKRTNSVPKYPAEQIAQIKFLLTLRRALVARHTAQITTLRATRLTVLALRQEAEQAAFAWLNAVIAALLPNRRMNALTAPLLLVQMRVAQAYERTCRALTQRCAGQQTDDLITTLVECVVWTMPPAAQNAAAGTAFRAALNEMGLAGAKQSGKALRTRRKTGAVLQVRPFLLHIIDALIAVEEHTPFLPLATCRAAWYRGLSPIERKQQFSSDEQNLVDGGLGSPRHGSESHQRIGMAVLLLAWLKQHATLSTDVLLLVALSERAARQLPNDAHLMSDILSNCYGAVCSNASYPLPPSHPSCPSCPSCPSWFTWCVAGRSGAAG